MPLLLKVVLKHVSTVPVTHQLIWLVPSSPSVGCLAENTSILAVSVATGLRVPVQSLEVNWDPAGLTGSFSTPTAVHAPIGKGEMLGMRSGIPHCLPQGVSYE